MQNSENTSQTTPDNGDNTDFDLKIPLINGGELPIPLKQGETLFLLGPNGSGKSSLLARWLSQVPASYRIAANRELFFNNKEIYAERNNLYKEEIEHSNAAQARWSSRYFPGISTDAKRNHILTQLINAEDYRNQQIVAAANANKERDTVLSHLTQINNLLKQANIHIQINLNKERSLIAKRMDTGTEYSFAEASDGERAAVLIAAEVLLAEQNRLFLIDEPERHLHRSISAPLLLALFKERPDCAFVISTHDLALARAIETAQFLLLRDCAYKGENPEKWDAVLISDAADIPEEIQTAILGARRKILFVEGTDSSPDIKLYTLLFPDYEIIPQGSCGAVIDAVKGIHATEKFNWLSVFGIIDNDKRNEAEQEKLLESSIYTLPVYAIESLYFCPEILSCMAQKTAESPKERQQIEAEAYQTLITAIQQHIPATARDRLARDLRREIKAPNAKDLEKPDVYIEALSKFNAESLTERISAAETELNALIEAGNIGALITQFNLKCVQNTIAKVFGYCAAEAYAKEVRKYLRTDETLREQIRQEYFTPLLNAMNEEREKQAAYHATAATASSAAAEDALAAGK